MECYNENMALIASFEDRKLFDKPINLYLWYFPLRMMALEKIHLFGAGLWARAGK